MGKLFAITAILALIVGFVRWQQPQTFFYTITIKNRAYGLGSDYWAFSIGTVFAILAAAYYWLRVLLSLKLSDFVSHLHFWLGASAAFSGYIPVMPLLGVHVAGPKKGHGKSPCPLDTSVRIG